MGLGPVIVQFFCFQNTDGPESLPDPSLPLAHQLEFALSRINEHVRAVANLKATCKSLDEVSFSLSVDTALTSSGSKVVGPIRSPTHAEVEG